MLPEPSAPRGGVCWLGPLALTLALSMSCNQDGLAREAIQDADTLTQLMLGAVAQTADKRHGVAQAQTRLDAARPELESKIVRLKRLRTVQLSPAMSAQWRDAFIDDMAAIESLRANLSVQTAADPTLARAVDALISDFSAMLSRRPREPR